MDIFDVLAQQQTRLRNQIAELRSLGPIDDPAILRALTKLDEANQKLRATLEHLLHSEIGKTLRTKAKPHLRLVK